MAVTEKQGVLRVRAFGAVTPPHTGAAAVSAPAAEDWGEIDAISYAPNVASPEAWGFTARYDFGFLETTIVSYIKLGDLVTTTYNVFRDRSGRADYWTREFFYLKEPPRAPHSSSQPIAPQPPAQQGFTRDRDRIRDASQEVDVDVTPLLATWVNFDATSRGIVRAEIVRNDARDKGISIRSFGANEAGLLSWDSAPAIPLSDDAAQHKSSGLITSLDLGFQRLVLVGYVNRGLLTLEAATTFTDGSPRARYLTRQHFYRLPRGG